VSLGRQVVVVAVKCPLRKLESNGELVQLRVGGVADQM